MAEDRKFLFGDIIIKNISLDKANRIRQDLFKNFDFKWIYVLKDKKNNCKIGIANKQGNRVTSSELKEIKKFLKDRAYT